ncbi:LEAF RUST 10 DISEASE-RESISTANCE LOCUS RECEPTOR-LIKE PROTEIN KINASE-like 2.3 [Ananas comosus]|uniref:LEAF RUST 10 DISEASE-RESISTANCE LOCUS RECEPTOR-LIKE PROTEIN KINASE-like 2.3 n=1 Tax=Ananas comosus TaxID=4615 RepID=A0A6P5G1K6_ANACO|nr:LEAF RUST 10 DISEASE-RESISTANCE LOCUS RECEPTOR-LIKE PROTEIN KINASE-like 2.3 [Ananas comosus]
MTCRLDDGRLVAVKGLKRARGSGKEFFKKVVGIGCSYHVNIVGLLGFYLEGSRRVLVYELMPNGSLESSYTTVTRTRQRRCFDWAKLLDIVTGIHTQPYPTSVLPKSAMLGARGTAGYIAPEVFFRSYGAVSSKSDVYSHRMVVLEMVRGRRNVEARIENTSELYFPYWIYIQKELRKHTENVTNTFCPQSQAENPRY